VILVIMLGLGAGIGVVGLRTSLRSSKADLIVALSALDSEPFETKASVGNETTRDLRALARHRLGTGTGELLTRFPSFADKISHDLLAADTTLDVIAERCVLTGAAGALLPFLMWSFLSLMSVSVPIALPAWVGLLGAAAGVAIPLVTLRGQASRGRRHARRVVGCYLDLVVLALAGGLGIEGALHAAASISEAPVALKIVRSLDEARDAGRTPWEALAALGRDLGVAELVELSSAVSLAGTEGARIRATLAAKATSIRSHELSDAETDANTITERLFLPGVLLLVGFLIFIGYPAIARFSAGI
jgi:Flp pilus assembly protein TadB